VTANLKAAPFPLAPPVVSALLNDRPARQLTTLPVYRLDEISSLEGSAPDAAPGAGASRRSWVEDYRANAEPETYNPALVRVALSRRGEIFRRTYLSASRAWREAERQRLAADAHRATDPFEQAKMFLQRNGPVFAADMHGGPMGKWFVSGQPNYLTEAELIALAEKKGWVAK
jgi:hypothetical protein